MSDGERDIKEAALRSPGRLSWRGRRELADAEAAAPKRVIAMVEKRIMDVIM